MAKEIIIITQSNESGWMPTEPQAVELENKIKALTGKEVIVLGPGMNVEVLTCGEGLEEK